MPGNPEQYLLKHLNHFHMKKIPIIINMCRTKTKPFFLLARPSQDVFLLPLIPLIEQGVVYKPFLLGKN